MTNIVKIPMLDTMFDELDDAFIDEKEDAHQFVWGKIRELCRDAKLGKLNKTCTTNIIKDGVQEQEHVKLKGLKLENLPYNSEWIPPNMDKEDIKYFEHKITDKTKEYLELFARFEYLRHSKYEESVILENQNKLDQMIEAKTNEKVLEDAKKNFEKSAEKFKKARPKCMEEVLYNRIFPSIHSKVNENIGKEFDKENEEMYPKEEKPSK